MDDTCIYHESVFPANGLDYTSIKLIVELLILNWKHFLGDRKMLDIRQVFINKFLRFRLDLSTITVYMNAMNNRKFRISYKE